jgi:hypothetical protein
MTTKEQGRGRDRRRPGVEPELSAGSAVGSTVAAGPGHKIQCGYF